MLKKSAKIYITGGSGLVGRNIMENPDILNCCILAPTHSEHDLMDYNSVLSFLKAEKPDIIIHTAGHVGGIKANMEDPYGFFTDNAVMGINVVRASKEAGVKNLLNLSSSCSYPCNISTPLKEDMIFTGKFEPTNEGYAVAKTAVLKMCEYITNQFPSFHYKTLIPCNLYGRYDKFSPQKSHLLPAIIRKLHEAKLKGLDNVEIWGDGLARREFMYAGDFACIVSEILKNFDKIPAVLNIGLGYDYTINEYYETTAKVLGFDCKFTHNLTKPSGMKQKLLDISMQKKLGFESRFSLEEGIRETYNYFLNEYKGE